MRHLKTVSVYLTPETISLIDDAKGNFSRSSWIAHELNKIIKTEK
jgi:hypothetical protein